MDLKSRFPDMTPLSSPPVLFTMNGVGTTVYGHRDYDAETQTYVKTMYFCVVFIPVIALRAYRVADAESGWYFLGRVPLSPAARSWNLALLAAVIGLCGLGIWNSYTDTPEYRARQAIADAESLAAAGETLPAAKAFRRTAYSAPPKESAQAVAGFLGLLDKALESGSPEETEGLVREAAEWRREGASAPAMPQLKTAGPAAAGRVGETDWKTGLTLLDLLEPEFDDRKQYDAAAKPVLERLAAKAGDDPGPAVRLAVIAENAGDLEGCRKLLAPYVKRLGVTEGARILGRLYAADGKLEEAHDLLVPYTEAKLARLHEAEKAFETAAGAAQERVLQALRSGAGDPTFYTRYQAADEAGKQELVTEHISKAISADPAVEVARRALARDAAVVPAALDLGIVLLRRGREMADPEARKREMERAERTFLAVRGVAGDSDGYRMSLGQVYYWLGKPAEGRKLFDETLAAANRSPNVLLGVAVILREVGSPAECRTLAEEAYNKAPDDAGRHGAANLRFVVAVDLDDKIAWLERSNPKDTDVQASLEESRGQKAVREGREADAEAHYRKALELHARLPVTATTLNNGALIRLALFQVTGNRSDLDQGLAMLDKAVSLKADNSIVLINAADAAADAAMREVVGAAIDLRALKYPPGNWMCNFLYDGSAGRAGVIKTVKAHPAWAKAGTYLNRASVLAPKSARIARELADTRYLEGDVEALTRLLARLEADPPDLTEEAADFAEMLDGSQDAKRTAELAVSSARIAEALKRCRPVGGATLAVAAVMNAGALTAVRTYGRPFDPDAAVKLAEEAHAAAPSWSTRETLASLLMVRAEARLSAKSPELAAVVAKCRRFLSPMDLLTALAGRPGPVREAILADPDVVRAAALTAESVRAVPENASSQDWALLKAARPEDPAVAAAEKAIREGKAAAVHRRITRLLSPYSAPAALGRYWDALLEGREADGLQSLREAAGRGLPLPWTP